VIVRDCFTFVPRVDADEYVGNRSAEISFFGTLLLLECLDFGKISKAEVSFKLAFL